MAEEFKPITTQEDFDNAVRARLERNTRTVTEEVTKKFEGHISPDDFKAKTDGYIEKINDLAAKVAEKDTTIADLTSKNEAYELNSLKNKIAHEFKIPYELAGKLSGANEKEIRADAEIFSKLIGQKTTAPLGSTEPPADSTKKSAYKNLLTGLTD